MSLVTNDHWHPAPGPVVPPPGPELDGYVTWKDATAAATLHNRGVISTDNAATWH